MTRLNILKLYQAISLHLEENPGDSSRFPGFLSTLKPYLTRGADGPLNGEQHSAEYFHGRYVQLERPEVPPSWSLSRDGLSDISNRHPDLNLRPPFQDLSQHPRLQATNKSGPELTIDLLRSHPPRSITYIALGPLTSLAQAVRLDSSVFNDKIGRIVCMGGAVDVPGNTTPVAECKCHLSSRGPHSCSLVREVNFFADPYAVKELLCPPNHGSGIALERFLLLPLDITTPHELPFPHYKTHVDPSFENSKSPSDPSAKTPWAHFTSSFLERAREVMLEFGCDHMELHDIAAVWCAIENPPHSNDRVKGTPVMGEGWSTAGRRFDIERCGLPFPRELMIEFDSTRRTGEITRGMLVVDRRLDDQSAYAPGSNRAEAQGALELHITADAIPAPVEVERPEDAKASGRAVLCVVKTPGPGALLKLLLSRVWGVSTV